MGNLFGGTTKTTSTEKSNTGPSEFQAPYLTQAFNAAQDNYNSTKDSPYYQGDTYAGMSEEQRATQARLKAYADGQGMSGANSINAVGSTLTDGTAGKAVSNLDRFTALAGSDPTQANIAAGMQYADNPFVSSQIDAASRDISRNLSEVQLPGIDRAASGSGNINSSRAGIASGIAQRGAADRVGDISASIRGDAYNRGVAQASNDRASTLAAYRDAAGSFADLAGQGTATTAQGTALGYEGLDRAAASGTALQADQQGELDAALKQWAGNDTRKQDLLERYMSTIGANAWGQSGTSSGTGTSKQGGNLFGQIAGAAATAASFASDRRLKKHIKKLGEAADGLGRYIWQYVWGGPQCIGVMADEVAALRPWALGPTVNGFASVNYSMLEAPQA